MAALLLFLTAAWAAEPSCDNPQAAARSLLDWLQPDNHAPNKAARCLNVPPGVTTPREQLAVTLKEILDAQGAYVPTDELPLDPEYTTEDGRSILPPEQVAPVNTIPGVYLERVGDQWMWSAETVRAIPQLQARTFSALGRGLHDRLPPSFYGRLLGLFAWQWLFFVLLGLASLATGWVAQRLLTDQLVRGAKRFGVNLDVAILNRTRLPINLAATGAVFFVGIPDLHLPVRLSGALIFIAQIVLSVAAVMIGLRVVDIAANFFARRAEATASKMDDQVIPLLSRGARVAVVLVGLVFVLQNAGVDVGGLLAGLGIGGLAFALAAKDTLENVFGSITIFTDRPFQIGDWVVIDGDIEGTVEEVGFRTTKIRTFYNSVVAVPNGQVANSKVDNLGLRHVRRLKLMLGVTYDATTEQIEGYVEDIRAYMKNHPSVWDKTLEIHFNNYSASSLDILVYSFLDVPNWSEELAARHEILLAFKRLAEERNLSFAFPSTSVYIESMPEGALPG